MKIYNRIKSLKKDYWIVLSIRALLRVLFVSNVFLSLDNVAHKKNMLEANYHTLSCVFYALFFYFLNWCLKNDKENIYNGYFINANALKWANFLKWISLFLAVSLILLNAMFIEYDFPDLTSGKILYIMVKILPQVLGKNISFIIITMLFFYGSAVSNINKKLQQEQDLTI